jgi:hypothetical protein
MTQHQKIETNLTDPDTKSMNLQMGKVDVLKTPFTFQKIQQETTTDNCSRAHFDFHICTWALALVFQYAEQCKK